MMQIAPDIGGALSPRQQDSRNLHRQAPLRIDEQLCRRYEIYCKAFQADVAQVAREHGHRCA